MLGVLLALALTAPPLDEEQDCERTRCTRARGDRTGVRPRPYFEFAPASGVGMGTACGHCANAVGYPESFDNAIWSKSNSGSSAPTVTANQAVAPSGATTADRIQVPAATGAERTFVIQTSLPTAAGSTSIYFKGNGTSGTIDFANYDSAYVCTTCSYNPTTWTRCSITNITGGVNTRVIFGNLSDAATCSSGAKGAHDIFAWGAKWEAGASVTDYVAAPSGSLNEALTFTRGSAGTCMTGGTTSSIANGSLVTCAWGQPRVMPGGDGTGGNGLLVEGARTNSALRSQEFDNVVYADYTAGGAAAPIITADQAVAPDGTTTADRVQFADTSAGSKASMRAQNPLGANEHAVCSIFAKGNGTSGTFSLVKYNNGIGTNDSVQCSFNASTWTRCATTSTLAASTSWSCYFGSGLAGFGAPNSASDVFLWGLQGEAGTFASSYIATTSAAVTRAVEAPSFTVPATAFNTAGSAAETVIMNYALPSAGGMSFQGAGRLLTFNSGGGTPGGISTFDGTLIAITAAGSNLNTVPHRMWSMWSGSSMTVTNVTDSLTDTETFDGQIQTGGGATILEIGNNVGGGGPLDGVIKAVCIDPSPTRCR